MISETFLLSSVAAVPPFHLCAAFHCVNSPQFIYPFNYWWAWGLLLFLLLVIIRNTSVNIVLMSFAGHQHSLLREIQLSERPLPVRGRVTEESEGQFLRQGPLRTAFHQRAHWESTLRAFSVSHKSKWRLKTADFLLAFVSSHCSLLFS